MKKVLLAAALFSGISIVSISSALTPVQSGGGDPSPGILSPICWTYGATQCSHPVSTRGCLVGIFVDLTDYVNTLGYTTHYVWACENAGLTTLCSVPKASSCASDADITLKTSYACGDTAFKVTASMYPMDELKNVSVTIKGTNVSTKETFTKTIGVHKTTGEGFASLVYDNKASNHYIGRGTFDLTVTASYNGQAVSVHDKNGDLVSSLTIDDLYMSDDCTDTVIIPGCMDASATNFNPNANEDNKSCLYVDPVAGCTDPLATNYNRNATRDDGSCTLQTTDVVVQRPDIGIDDSGNKIDTTVTTGDNTTTTVIKDDNTTTTTNTTNDTPNTTTTNTNTTNTNTTTTTNTNTNTNTTTTTNTNTSGTGDNNSVTGTQTTTSGDSSEDETAYDESVDKLYNNCRQEDKLDSDKYNSCVEHTAVASVLLEKGLIKSLPRDVSPDEEITIALRAFCGDGYVYKGIEECDNGEENGDSMACTSQCKIAYCGDGLIWDGDDRGDEQCDGGEFCEAKSCQYLPGVEALDTQDPEDTGVLSTNLESAPEAKNPIIKIIAKTAEIVKEIYEALPTVVKLGVNIAGVLVLLLISMVAYGMISRRIDHHIVKDGETVASIALQYGTTDRKIRKLNRKTRTWEPKVGKSIKVPNRHFTDKNSLDQLKEVLADGLGTKLGNRGKNKMWGHGNKAAKEQKKMEETVELATSIQKNAGLLEQLAQEQSMEETVVSDSASQQEAPKNGEL